MYRVKIFPSIGALLLIVAMTSGAVAAPLDSFSMSGDHLAQKLRDGRLNAPSLPRPQDFIGQVSNGKVQDRAQTGVDTVTGVLVVVDDVGTRVLDVLDPVLAQVASSLAALVQTDIPRLTHELNQVADDLSLMELVEALQWIGREWEGDELLEVVLQDAGGPLNLVGILEAVQDLVAGVDEQTATDLVGEILEGLDAEELEGGQSSLARTGARAGSPDKPVSSLLNRVADTTRTTTDTVNSLLGPAIEQGPQQLVLLLRSVPEPASILLAQVLETGHGTVDNVLSTFAPTLARIERQRLHPAIQRAEDAADNAARRLRMARRDLQRRPEVRDFRRELDRRRAIAQSGFAKSQRLLSHGLQNTVSGTGELAADLLEGVAELPKAARKGPDDLAGSMASTAKETASNTSDILTVVLLDTAAGLARTGAETAIAITGFDSGALRAAATARATDARRRFEAAASRSPLQVDATFDRDRRDGSVGGELTASFDTKPARETAQNARDRLTEGRRRLRQAARSAAESSPVQIEGNVDRDASDGVVGGDLTVTIDVMPDAGSAFADTARQAATNGRERLAQKTTDLRERTAQRREATQEAIEQARERSGASLETVRNRLTDRRDELREAAAELRDRAAERRQGLFEGILGR